MNFVTNTGNTVKIVFQSRNLSWTYRKLSAAWCRSDVFRFISSGIDCIYPNKSLTINGSRQVDVIHVNLSVTTSEQRKVRVNLLANVRLPSYNGDCILLVDNTTVNAVCRYGMQLLTNTERLKKLMFLTQVNLTRFCCFYSRSSAV